MTPADSIGIPTKTVLEVFDFKLNNRTPVINYLTIIGIAKDAFEHFQQRRFTYNDALVGENACQLRAWKIAELAQIYSPDFFYGYTATARDIYQTLLGIQHEVEHAQANAERFQKWWISAKNKTAQSQHKVAAKALCALAKSVFDTAQKAQEAIIQERIKGAFADLRITEDLQFIIQSYLLTVTKDQSTEGNDDYGFAKAETSNFRLLAQKYQCSNVTAEALMKIARKQLAHQSLNYVRKVALEIQHPVAIDRLQDRFVLQNTLGVRCAPAFYEIVPLLEWAKVKTIPIVISIKCFRRETDATRVQRAGDIAFLFASRGPGQPFRPVDSQTVEASTAAVVIKGICVIRSSEADPEKVCRDAFAKYQLEPIILANFAQHAPYPKDVKAIDLPVEPQLQVCRENAEKFGCCPHNSSAFLARHIFCATVGEYFSKPQTAKGGDSCEKN